MWRFAGDNLKNWFVSSKKKYIRIIIKREKKKRQFADCTRRWKTALQSLKFCLQACWENDRTTLLQTGMHLDRRRLNTDKPIYQSGMIEGTPPMTHRASPVIDWHFPRMEKDFSAFTSRSKMNPEVNPNDKMYSCCQKHPEDSRHVSTGGLVEIRLGD